MTSEKKNDDLTMKITRLEDSGDRKVLYIEAPWSEIETDYQDVLARYTRLRIPGFRPGKAPAQAVEQRFKNQIMDDLKATVTQRLGKEVLRDSGVEAFGPVEASDIECETGRLFRARIHYLPLPEFQLPELADLKTEDDGTNERDLISRRLLDTIRFDVPAELVREELARDDAAECTPGNEAWVAAEERIRLMIILKKIALQEGIEVDDADVNKRIAEKAEEFGTTKDALRKELEDGGGMARLSDLLIAESTLGYLVDINQR